MFVNGQATRRTGVYRQYISRGLQSGYSYKYEIRAELNRNGRLVSDTKTVTLRAGQRTSLRFDLQPQQASPIETTVSIRVPSDAKVFLAGHLTKSTGSQRTFTTTKLAAGEAWDNYTIRVEADVNGQRVSQTRTIRLVGVENQSLSFLNSEDKVAANAADTR